jgi:predicted transcriptional regulator of viral defense system
VPELPSGGGCMANLNREKRTTVGVELVRLLASEGERIFTTERAREVCGRVGMNEGYVVEALFHLRKTGWIVPIRRGLYAISSATPGVSPAHEFEVAMALVNPAAISHWSALNFHGLSDQVPRTVFVTTTSRAVPRRRLGRAATGSGKGYLVGDTAYRFVQIKPDRYFGTETVWLGEARVVVTDPERTLIDGLTMPHLCGDFAEVLEAFRARSDELDIARIIDYALKLDAVTAKRLGWVLEDLGIEPFNLGALESVRLQGYGRLDPSGPDDGPSNRRWMVRENLPGKVGS